MGERRPSYSCRDHRDGESSNSWRPPRSYGGGYLSVPLWEKKFCTDANAIPWGKLCETKRLMSMYKNVVDWDDSAALGAFNKAKARFWAEYHGQPCDIPLPDPDMYNDVINPDEYVDRELVADLEKTRHVIPERDDEAPNGWDSFIFTNKPVPATGWGDVEASDHPGQQWSLNWDTYVEQSVQTNGRGEAIKHSTWDKKDESFEPRNSNRGWVGGAVHPDSWGGRMDSSYWSDSQGGSFGGHWNRRQYELGRRNGRKRDGGGHFGPRATKPKHRENDHDSNNNWRNCKGRNNVNYCNDKPGYAKQPLAM